MSATTKTTVYLDSVEYERLKVIARRERRLPAALVREAVAEYTKRRQSRVLPGSVGIGHSGRGDLSRRTDELLAGFGDERRRRTR